jgi:hypothetical protein
MTIEYACRRTHFGDGVQPPPHYRNLSVLCEEMSPHIPNIVFLALSSFIGLDPLVARGASSVG